MTSTARSKFKSKKGPACTICGHPERARIEATRIAGASLDNIAAKYTIGRDALWRHMARHVPEDVRAQYLADVPIKELAARASAEGVSLLDYFAIVRGVLLQQFQLAASVKDKNGTAVLAGRLTEVLREIGRITGELMRSPAVQNVTTTINFVNSPIFVDLQGQGRALGKRHDGFRLMKHLLDCPTDFNGTTRPTSGIGRVPFAGAIQKLRPTALGDDRKILSPFDKRECISLKEAAGVAGNSESTLRAWCEGHGLGRRIGGGTWSVSKVALAMFLDGDARALQAYHSGDRTSERVAGYFERVGLGCSTSFPRSKE